MSVPSPASDEPVLSASRRSEYSSSLSALAPAATPLAVHPLNVSENASLMSAEVASPENTTTPESMATSGLAVLDEARKALDAFATSKDGFCKYLGKCV